MRRLLIPGNWNYRSLLKRFNLIKVINKKIAKEGKNPIEIQKKLRLKITVNNNNNKNNRIFLIYKINITQLYLQC